MVDFAKPNTNIHQKIIPLPFVFLLFLLCLVLSLSGSHLDNLCLQWEEKRREDSHGLN